VGFDGRPVASLDVDGGTVTRTLAPAAPSPSTLDLIGWSDGAIVARRKESL
jgi:hypothetical protein